MDTRSFLLGGFAVLIAGVGAQAAELPYRRQHSGGPSLGVGATHGRFARRPRPLLRHHCQWRDCRCRSPGGCLGWAVGAGLRVNLPSPGDGFDVQAQYCRGWSGRCIINSSARLADQTFGLVNSGTIGLAWVDDAFMANSAATGATQLQLPAAWNIYAGVQHYWAARTINSARAARIGRPGKSDRAPYGIRPGASTSASPCNTRRSARPHLPAAP